MINVYFLDEIWRKTLIIAPQFISTMAKKIETKPTLDFPFGKENFMLMIIGIAIIVIGFALMSGGGTEDPSVWDPSIFSTRRITIAPIVVVLGLIIEIYAILKKSKD